jgi:hypothetical protein
MALVIISSLYVGISVSTEQQSINSSTLHAGPMVYVDFNNHLVNSPHCLLGYCTNNTKHADHDDSTSHECTVHEILCNAGM